MKKTAVDSIEYWVIYNEDKSRLEYGETPLGLSLYYNDSLTYESFTTEAKRNTAFVGYGGTLREI